MNAFLFALSFLTIIPVKGVHVEKGVHLGAGFFPFVGLILGGVLVFIQWIIGERLFLNQIESHLMALVLVSILIFLTGGLHVDGTADVADGMGGGRGDRERTLAIMRDTRVGSFGVIAIVILILAKVILIAELIRISEGLAVLLTFPAIGRLAVVPLIAWLPYGRPDGLGRDLHDKSGLPAVILATTLMIIVMGVVGRQLILPAVAATGVAIVFGMWLTRRLGGLTGDGYGASIELAEVIFLLIAVLTTYW